MSSHPAAIVDARAVDADRAGEAIVVEGEVAEELGEPAVRLLQGEVDLEEAFAGGHEPLREPEVLERVGREVGDAVPIAQHLDGSAEARDGEFAVHRERSSGRAGRSPSRKSAMRAAA